MTTWREIAIDALRVAVFIVFVWFIVNFMSAPAWLVFAWVLTSWDTARWRNRAKEWQEKHRQLTVDFMRMVDRHDVQLQQINHQRLKERFPDVFADN